MSNIITEHIVNITPQQKSPHPQLTPVGPHNVSVYYMYLNRSSDCISHVFSDITPDLFCHKTDYLTAADSRDLDVFIVKSQVKIALFVRIIRANDIG